ncbi:MAG: methylmalonyl-CoA mutase [Aequorivita sp.]|nr:methylmalonyl-CoA mutase [Aequorivita sp.]|tara:strand:- start:50380 stop:51801 length:1422 start_codon:yes stop_codon:yes gene_type:complete
MSKVQNTQSFDGFTDFNEVSAKQWKQKIQVDLKGADYNETLVWNSPEGIHVKPFYHQDDFKEDFQNIPGQPKAWRIVQKIFVDNEEIANSIALDAIKRGAEAIVFKATKKFNLQALFNNFPFENIPIYFQLNFLSKNFYTELFTFFSTKNATVFYNIDLLGNLAKTGNWYQNLNSDHEILDTLLKVNLKENIIGVDLSLYQNAGATVVQQLAYAMAHVNEYLNHLFSQSAVSKTVEKDAIKEVKITFNLAVGSNYFFEIAKIRALRKLFATLAKEYGINETCHIIATPSKRNKTLYDYNVNLLRSTTECMSAILGGADAVCNMPYDEIFHKRNEFGDRIARNQLLILKHESYFNAVSNPADGAYYIESLTDELAEKALQIFKDIEKGGGFLQLLKEGTIQKKIKESADKEEQLFESGEVKLLGTNYHPNQNDKIKNDLELFPFVKRKPVKTIIAPIVEKRLAENVEQQRLSNE